jgi:beta-galactosidase
MKQSEKDSRRVNRRDALKGLAGFAAIPLFTKSASGEQGQSAANIDRASEVAPLSARLREQSLDPEWRFSRGDATGAEDTSFDDSKWRRVDLPHDWSIEDLVPASDATGQGTIWVGGNTPTRIGPFDMALSGGQEATGWVVGGTGWYRKHVPLPALDRHAQASMVFT